MLWERRENLSVRITEPMGLNMNLRGETLSRGRGSVVQGGERRVSVRRDRTGAGAEQSLERQTEWNGASAGAVCVYVCVCACTCMWVCMCMHVCECAYTCDCVMYDRSWKHKEALDCDLTGRRLVLAVLLAGNVTWINSKPLPTLISVSRDGKRLSPKFAPYLSSIPCLVPFFITVSLPLVQGYWGIVPLARNQHCFYSALYLRSPNKLCHWEEGDGCGKGARERGKDWGRDVERLSLYDYYLKLTNTLWIKPIPFLPLLLLTYHLQCGHLITLGFHRQGFQNPQGCAWCRMLLRTPFIRHKAPQEYHSPHFWLGSRSCHWEGGPSPLPETIKAPLLSLGFDVVGSPEPD